MPLPYFGVVAPIFILAFHLFALLMARGLRDKIIVWQEVIRHAARIGKHRQRLRQRLDTSLLAQAFGGGEGLYGRSLTVLAWTIMVLGPLGLLWIIEIVFLPYQGRGITDFHRVALLLECGIVIALWSCRWPTVCVAISFIASSWFILVFPDRPPSYAPFVDFALEELPPLREFVRQQLTADPDLVRRGSSRWFSNRLVLPDQNLAAELGKEGATPNLRGRRLASAILDRSDLHGVDFTGADLRRASLQAAQLQKAVFECADTGALVSVPSLKVPDKGTQRSTAQYSEPVRVMNCALLQGAQLGSARLEDASLTSAYMAGASLQFARLDRGSLRSIQAQGASFDHSQLGSADLYDAQLDGASFRSAEMAVAVLQRARAPGVNFDEAKLFAADLSNGFFRNASFRGAQLQGADIKNAVFEESLFLGVATYRVSPTEAFFSNAVVYNLDNKARWDLSYSLGWFDLYGTDTLTVFAMDGDGKYAAPNNFSPYPAPAYSDTSLFQRREAITTKSIEEAARVFGVNSQQESRVQPAKLGRFDGLKPEKQAGNADQSDEQAWMKLTKQSASAPAYQQALAARLEHIACTRAEGTDDLRFEFAPPRRAGTITRQTFR